jgi:hypothetical protein
MVEKTFFLHFKRISESFLQKLGKDTSNYEKIVLNWPKMVEKISGELI